MTIAPGRIAAILRHGTFGLLALALLCGMLLPVYSDEVGWRFQERAWIDGVDKLYSDQCGPNTLARPLFFMWPARAYSAFFNTHFADPFYVRVSGVLYALVWLWLLMRLIARVAPSRQIARPLATIACALAGLGVLPLLLVWSRPEQPLLLCLTTALLIAANGWSKSPAIPPAPSPSPALAWGRSLAILALGLVALSYHGKALLLIPAFIVAIATASPGRKTLLARIACGLVLTAATAAATAHWYNRLACTTDPLIAAQYAHRSFAALRPENANLGEILLAMAGNYNLARYVQLTAPLVKPMSQWLVPGQVTHAQQAAFQTALMVLWGVTLAVAALAALRALWAARHDWRLPPALLLALALFGGISVWCITQITRNVYESSFVLPVLIIAIVLALSAAHGSRHLDRATKLLALALPPAMVASMTVVAALYAPDLVATTQQRAYLDQHRYSLPVFGYSSIKPDILGAARQCGLAPDKPASNVMVDDLTYFTFMQSRLPQNQLGILSRQLRGSLNDPVAYLAERQSSGAILGCHWLPPELRARAHQQGRFCCLAPPSSSSGLASGQTR